LPFSGNIPCDSRDPDDLPGLAFDRRKRHGHINDLAILRAALRVKPLYDFSSKKTVRM
jgi:hypothetical protein